MAKLTKRSNAYTYGVPGLVHPDEILKSAGPAGKALADSLLGIQGSSSGGASAYTLPSYRSTKVPGEAVEHIVDAISQSKKILDLQYDWDEAGSPGYKRKTWERAKNFLLENAANLWQINETRIDAPKILPGPDGSIDIHWKAKRHELLINIPEELSELAGYYGDNEIGQSVKGTLDTSRNHSWLWMWLIQ